MQDQSDDVRAVAAEALLPLATALAADPPQALQQILWDILLEVEELSPSTGLRDSSSSFTFRVLGANLGQQTTSIKTVKSLETVGFSYLECLVCAEACACQVKEEKCRRRQATISGSS